MTTQELRELDAWLAENVMGWSFVDGLWRVSPTTIRNFHPTILASDAVDVLKKCAEKCGVRICYYSGRSPMGWDIYATDGTTKQSEAETLELAICLFAKQLFSQTTK